MDIIIGTRVSGEGTLTVQNNFTSGRHCRVFSGENNAVFIEDLSSTNGTYVNGHRVVRYMLGDEDEILLGGPQGYKTTLANIVEEYAKAEEARRMTETVKVKGGAESDKPAVAENPKDVPVECLDMLHKIEKDHKKAELDIVDKINSLMMIRIFPATITGVLTTAVSFMLPEYAALVGIGGGCLTLILLIVIMAWTSKRSRRLRELQEQKRDEYKKVFACPTCRRSLARFSWFDLNQDGCCPRCKQKYC